MRINGLRSAPLLKRATYGQRAIGRLGSKIWERLSGQRVYWPTRSIMKDAINHSIDSRLGRSGSGRR